MTSEHPFAFRSILLPAVAPTLLFSIGEGAIIPIIPVIATDLGATLAIAGFIGAMIMIGELLGDIPSGWIVSRIGERNAMIYASLLSTVGLGLALIAPGPFVLGAGIFLIGISTAVFALARHAFMTSFVPREFRARALSTLGGTFRAGAFVGPFLSAGVIHLTGSPQSVFWVHIACCLAAAALLVVLRDPTETITANRVASAGRVEAERETHGLFRTVWNARGMLLRLGTGTAIVAAMRSSRQVILPLWAVSIGLAETQTALIIGIAGGLDFALFYASGQIMDRYGRLWSVVPSLIGLSAGHFLLAFTHDASDATAFFIAAALLLALANGLGSGILMTLGSDVADPRDPAPLLGAMRFTTDVGSALSPVVLSAITALATISLASGVVGVVGLIGAAVMLRYVPRYSPHTRKGRTD